MSTQPDIQLLEVLTNKLYRVKWNGDEVTVSESGMDAYAGTSAGIRSWAMTMKILGQDIFDAQGTQINPASLPVELKFPLVAENSPTTARLHDQLASLEVKILRDTDTASERSRYRLLRLAYKYREILTDISLIRTLKGHSIDPIKVLPPPHG